MVCRESEFNSENRSDAILISPSGLVDETTHKQHVEQCGQAYAAISHKLPLQKWVSPNAAIESVEEDGIFLLDLIPVFLSRWLVPEGRLGDYAVWEFSGKPPLEELTDSAELIALYRRQNIRFSERFSGRDLIETLRGNSNVNPTIKTVKAKNLRREPGTGEQYCEDDWVEMTWEEASGKWQFTGSHFASADTNESAPSGTASAADDAEYRDGEDWCTSQYAKDRYGISATQLTKAVKEKGIFGVRIEPPKKMSVDGKRPRNVFLRVDLKTLADAIDRHCQD